MYRQTTAKQRNAIATGLDLSKVMLKHWLLPEPLATKLAFSAYVAIGILSYPALIYASIPWTETLTPVLS